MLRITSEFIKTRIAGRLTAAAAAGAGNLPLPANLLSISGDEEFLNAAYHRVFGRDIDLDAFLWLSNTLREYPRKFVVDSLYESPEAAAYAHRRGGPVDLTDLFNIDSDATFVKAAYLFILRRAADPAGVEFYVDLLARGFTRHDILSRLAGCDEGRKLDLRFTVKGIPLPLPPDTGTMAHVADAATSIDLADLFSIAAVQDFISAAYLRMFARAVDPAGLEHWTDRLREGMTRPAMLLALAGTEEARRSYTVKGVPLQAAIRVLEFVSPARPQGGSASGSIELAPLCALPDDVEFIRAAYRAILCRDAEPEGLSFALDILRADGSREEILARLATSPEGRSKSKHFLIAGEHVEQAALAFHADDLADLPAIKKESDFIHAAYLRLFGRYVDRAGQAHWLRELQQGATRIQILLALAATEELLPIRYTLFGVPLELAGKMFPPPPASSPLELAALGEIEDSGHFVFEAYRSILDRLPDFRGFSEYWALTTWGISKEQIAARIAGSAEAASRNLTFVWNGAALRDRPLHPWWRLRLFLRRSGSGSAANQYALCEMRQEMHRHWLEQCQIAALTSAKQRGTRVQRRGFQ